MDVYFMQIDSVIYPFVVEIVYFKRFEFAFLLILFFLCTPVRN